MRSSGLQGRCSCRVETLGPERRSRSPSRGYSELASSASPRSYIPKDNAHVGFNGSKYEAVPWPVMNVTLAQNVIIHVINNDSVEPHGFQVIHYFDQGINGLSGLAPGQCYDVRFTANVLGSFTVQCNIFCTIHQVMLKGQLNVEP